MEIIRWDDSYSVRIASIDKQHQSLFNAINDFYDSIIQQKGAHEATLKLLNKLKEYTVYHFQSEEQLMQRYQFPMYGAHKKEHDEFIEKINNIEERIMTGKLVISIEITSMIKDWIENHIRKTDMAYSSFLLSHGVH